LKWGWVYSLAVLVSGSWQGLSQGEPIMCSHALVLMLALAGATAAPGQLDPVKRLPEDRPQAEPLLREALIMQQRLMELGLAGASEAEALNLLGQLPSARDAYLTATAGRPDSDARTYALIWEGKACLTRWLDQRRQALAADPAGRGLRRQLAHARQALDVLLLSPDAPADQLRDLSEHKEALERRVSERLPLAAAPAGRRDAENLRRALPPGTVFIDLVRYVRLEGKPGQGPGKHTASYVAFVTARDQDAKRGRVELGPAGPIEEALAAWQKDIAAEKDGDAARTLRRLVWEPLAKRLPAGTETVLLAPDGALHRLPWAALPGAKKGTVLLEDYALAVVPNGLFLAERLTAAAGPVAKKGGLLAVGAVGEVPAGKPKPGILRCAQEQGKKLTWKDLPGMHVELERVVELTGPGAVVRRGKEASAQDVLDELTNKAPPRWLHLATHGFFADAALRGKLGLDPKHFEVGRRGERVGVGTRSPLALAGLVLHEDLLTAEAIAGLGLDGLELVVLSGSETALGEVVGGEGTFGLPRAFHLAGARNVIGSLWRVDDEATCALVSLFYYKLWREKKTPLEALRQAQLALYYHPERIAILVRERGPDFAKAARLAATPQAAGRSPARLWAGFILSGAGR
jgi:CHAT domain-containing protein